MSKDWHNLKGVGYLRDGPEGTAMAIAPDGEERNDERLDIKTIVIILVAFVTVMSVFYWLYTNYGPRSLDVPFSETGAQMTNEIACQHIMYEHNVSTSQPNFSCAQGKCTCHLLIPRSSP